jgi:hypothetical protein
VDLLAGQNAHQQSLGEIEEWLSGMITTMLDA